MKTVNGKIVSTKPVSLSKAANILSNFVTSDNGVSQPVTAYLRRASEAFDELVYLKKHNRLKKKSSKDEALTRSDLSRRSLKEEDEGRALENGVVKKEFEQGPVEVDGNRSGEVEGKLKKKKKKKEGSLENKNIKVELEEGSEMMNKKNEEKMKTKKKRKNAEVDGGEIGNSVTPEKKKRRKIEADD
ncbi:hypothetical protein QVD17_36908 [Tagetes erecta]|uniref:Uncharacterized protein n=1 Tax=Tagetes erecta TaxID=13708 RepID=A0AAD8NIQ4_TARER|nr:hypothetical protein QVD17_36908 [Tagetes erecta]